MKRLLLLFFCFLFAGAVHAADYRFERDILYRTDASGDYARRMCRLDVACPPDAEDAPVVVWFHGGGLTGGKRAVPEGLNFSENCIKSETMLAFLAEEQIYVSSASACGRGQPSHTLAAMGRSPLAIDTAIRVSFCADNTPEDVDAFLNRFEDGMKHLQRIKR